jgi:PAS domain-containing protein
MVRRAGKSFECQTHLSGGGDFIGDRHRHIFDRTLPGIAAVEQRIEESACTREDHKKILQESETRYRQLIEASHDMVWETDGNAVFTFVSHHVGALLGYEPDEVIGKKALDFTPAEEVADLRSVFDASCRQAATLLEDRESPPP